MRASRVVSAAVGLAMAASLAACSGSGDDPNDGSSSNCWSQVVTTGSTPQGSLSPSDPNYSQIMQGAQTVQNVCVLDDQGNERYYNRNDGLPNFMDYALMSWAFGHSMSPFMAAGVVSGTISPFEAVVFDHDHLLGVDQGGRVYRPWSIYNGSYRYGPDYDHVYVGDSMRRVTTVRTVYTGTSRTGMSYASFYKSQPRGYALTRAAKVSTGTGYYVGANGSATKLNSSQFSQVSQAQTNGSYGISSSYGPSKKYWQRSGRTDSSTSSRSSSNPFKSSGGGGTTRRSSTGRH